MKEQKQLNLIIITVEQDPNAATKARTQPI